MAGLMQRIDCQPHSQESEIFTQYQPLLTAFKERDNQETQRDQRGLEPRTCLHGSIFFTTLDLRTTDMVPMRLCGILHTAKNIKFMKYFHVILQSVVYSLGEILGSHASWAIGSFIINNSLARDILQIRLPPPGKYHQFIYLEVQLTRSTDQSFLLLDECFFPIKEGNGAEPNFYNSFLPTALNMFHTLNKCSE